MGRISYFQMEISLGRWNTKLFLRRRSYLWSKKKGIQKDPRLFEKYFSLKHALPRPGNRACGFFLKTSNLTVLGLKKQELDVLRKLEAPSSQSKKQGEDPRDRDYSDKWKLSYNVSIKPTLSRPAGNRACGFFPQDVQFEPFGGQKVQKSILRKGLVARFSQDVQFELFGRQKAQKERLEKRFGGSIPGASWKRFSYPAVLNHILPYIYSFSRTRQESSHQTFSQDALFGFLAAKKLKLDFLRK